MPTPVEQIPPLRQPMTTAPYRPLYHFSPPANYLGDSEWDNLLEGEVPSVLSVQS